MSVQIGFKNLEIGYNRRVVAGPFNGSIESGNLIAILGANASGKTTFLRTILKLQSPVRGRVELDSRERVAYVQQLGDFDTTFPITVREVVAMGIAKRTSRHVRRERIRVALQRVDMEATANALFFHLSGGQRQRVQVARALVADASVIALDEPTSGVDPDAARRLWKLLADIAQDQDRLVIVVTHDANAVAQFSARTLVIRDGRLEEDTHAAPIY